MTRRDLAILIALSTIWGASFMFIKVAVRELEPATLIFVRLTLAAATLALILPFSLRRRFSLRGVKALLGPLVVMGLFNAAVPFWLLSWAEQRIDSGLAAVLQAPAPLFTALLAIRFSRSERATGSRLAGLVVGFVGVAVLVGGVGGGNVIAALAVVLCGLCYAATALYAGTRLADTPTILISFGSTLCAALVTAPVGIAQMPAHLPGWKVMGSVAALAVGATALGFLLFFALLASAGASRAILVTYLVPALALVYGVTLLGEPLTGNALAGLALILSGVALGTGGVRFGERRRAQPADV